MFYLSETGRALLPTASFPIISPIVLPTVRSLPKYDNQLIEQLRPMVSRPSPGITPLQAWLEKEAIDKHGNSAEVLTLLLRGSECRFRCLMCDLWKGTHEQATRPGAIAAQVADACQRHTCAQSVNKSVVPSIQRQWIKLYNAANFFSTVNVPGEDLNRVANTVKNFERVIVENHPRLRPPSIERFRSSIHGRLEVAMGLETVHAETLQALNKQMDTNDFRYACDWLLDRNIDIRTFVLLRPPGMEEEEGIEWCIRSVQFAMDCGVRHVSIIPLRSGNGSIERLAADGLFSPPSADSLEQVLLECVTLPGVVTADLWNWMELRGHCASCNEPRRTRLEAINLQQAAPLSAANTIVKTLRCGCMVGFPHDMENDAYPAS